eukprot:Filipodium_phascolosomae@DN5668_c0_g1_i1.p1
MCEVTVGVLALQGAFHEHKEAISKLGKPHLIVTEVRSVNELQQCDAIIIPGGESTTMRIIAHSEDFMQELIDFVRLGKPVWGTCAGCIMLADEVVSGSQVPRHEQPADVKQPTTPVQSASDTSATVSVSTVPALISTPSTPSPSACMSFSPSFSDGFGSNIGGFPIKVSRNFFGRQVDSFNGKLQCGPKGLFDGMEAVCIRAPAILETLNPNVSVLGTVVCPRTNIEVIGVARYNNMLASIFHPELTPDLRLHRYFIEEMVFPSKK